MNRNFLNKFDEGLVEIPNQKGQAVTIVVIVVALVVLASGIYLYKKGTTFGSTGSTPLYTSIQNPASKSSSLPADRNSDSSIELDLQNTDNNLNSLNSESTNIDSSLNQQQVDPTQ